MWHGADDDECPPCPCGTTSVKRTVRKEGANSGRQFFTCSKQQTDTSRCDFFQWTDTPPNPSSSRSLPSFQSNSNSNFPNHTAPSTNSSFAFSNENAATDAPQCECGIQAVERTVKKSGPNCGRGFYTCSKNQDDSSKCNLFQVCMSHVVSRHESLYQTDTIMKSVDGPTACRIFIDQLCSTSASLSIRKLSTSFKSLRERGCTLPMWRRSGGENSAKRGTEFRPHVLCVP